jgi:acetylornithine deacetylase
VISGGIAANVVPDRCVLDLSVRPLPGTHAVGIVGSVRDAVADAAGEMPFLLEQTGESPPLLLDADAPVHRTLCALTGQESDAAVSYATDAGWLARAGIECAVFGPGSITEAHKPNEFVSRADLARTRTYLEQAVERMLCRRR